MNKKNLHTIFLSLAAFLTLILLIITPFWWTTGGLEEFKTWYPDWGILLWIVKWIFILISITSGLYLLSLLHKPVRENTFLFFLFVALSWRIGEQHPFSRIPMYHSFPEHAYVFYLEDQNNLLIPFKTISRLHAAEMSHLYYSALKNRNISYGKGREDSLVNYYHIGLEVFENIDWYSEEDKVGLKLKRKLLITQNDKLIEEEKILYEKSLE